MHRAPAVRWTEVRVLSPVGWHEVVAEVLARPPCTSVAFGGAGVGLPPPPEGFDHVCSYIPDHLDTPAVRAGLTRALDALAAATGADELRALTVEFEELPPEDYATSWRKSWKPFRVGRLCLLPHWDERAPRAGELRLTIEPGGVFGSGRHVTTRTCLRAIQALVHGGERVLDAGSGSGVLSVAAALVGARESIGFDVDPVAERYADALARNNGVAERCSFLTAGFEVLEQLEGRFDLVVSNIYSDVIRAQAEALAARLEPAGSFVFSGCPERDRDATRSAIQGAGLAIETEHVRGRWVTFVGRGQPPGWNIIPRHEAAEQGKLR